MLSLAGQSGQNPLPDQSPSSTTQFSIERTHKIVAVSENGAENDTTEAQNKSLNGNMDKKEEFPLYFFGMMLLGAFVAFIVLVANR